MELYRRKRRRGENYLHIGSGEEQPSGVGLVDMTQRGRKRTKRYGTGRASKWLSPREETSTAPRLVGRERVQGRDDLSELGKATYNDATGAGVYEVVRGIDEGDAAIFMTRSPRLERSEKITPAEKEAAVTNEGREDTAQELPEGRSEPDKEQSNAKPVKTGLVIGETTTPEPEPGSAQRRGQSLPLPPQRPTQEPVGLVDSAADDQIARWRRKYGQGGPGLRTNESQRRWEEDRNRMRTRVARDQARQNQRAYEADVQAYGSLVDAAQRQQAAETEAKTQRDIAEKKAEIMSATLEQESNQESNQGAGLNIMKVPGGGLVVQGENFEYIPETRPEQKGEVAPIFDDEGYQVGTQYSAFNPETGKWEHGGGGQSEPAEIRKLRGEIEAHMTQIAGKDDRHFLKVILSRKKTIRNQLAKLNRLERQYGLPVTRMPAGMLDDIRERGAVPSLVDNRYQFGGGQQQGVGNSANGGQMAYVKDLETGEIKAVPREKVSVYIDRGGVEVNEAEAEKYAKRKYWNDVFKRRDGERYLRMKQ